MRKILRRLLPHRRPVIVAVHLGLIAFSYASAFLLRFEFHLLPVERKLFLESLPLVILARMLTFAWFHLYDGLWRYVSMRDIVVILQAVTTSSAVFVGAVVAIFGNSFPLSILILDWVLCFVVVGGVRLVLRAIRETAWRASALEMPSRLALIVGAGDAGEMLMREIGRSALSYQIVGFVDDDPKKQGRRIHGVEVLGTIDQIPALCRSRNVEDVLVAIPSTTSEVRRRVLERCHDIGVAFKSVPALRELLQGRARIHHLREVSPEDLLGREAVRLDVDALRQELQGRRILVTGGAGSIGSELCRQLAAFEPEMLILYERAESNLYFVDLELRRTHPSLKVVSIIGDILDEVRVNEVVRTYAPEFLYHAAAYKHVPLLEEHSLEGIRNNVFGTEVLARAALRGGLKKFVLISTDKAVNPVGVMGATKRASECLVRALGGGGTTFVAVRFGNVLGSDGSVLPLFKWQIASGGPITVTDPEATRYFMLLSEAAQLVLQASVMGSGGEVFFLDMGEPVKILDLAHNLVRLSGLEPQRDIAIDVIGLRPGERLSESLVMNGEELIPTEHEKVYVVRNGSHGFTGFENDLTVLRDLLNVRDREGAVEQLRRIVSRY